MKIGKYYYPRYDLKSLTEDVKVLYGEYAKTEITREHIATKLKCSSTSGGFGQKLADFRAYGLLDGRGTFHVTDLGMKASGYGTDQEKAEAMDSAVRKIELWRLIYEKWGTSIPADTFWIDLAEITGVERSESKTEADSVRKAYMDDARYLLSVKTPVKEPEPVKPSPINDPEPARGRSNQIMTEPTQTASKDFVAYLGFPEYIERPLVIKDPLSLGIAKELMKAIEDRITKSNQPPNSDDTGDNS